MDEPTNGTAQPAAVSGVRSGADEQKLIDEATDLMLKRHGMAPKETPPSEEQIAAEKARAADAAKAAEEPPPAGAGAPEGEGGEETAEEKAAREAEEAAAATPEAKAAEAEKAETETLVKARLKDLPAEHQALVQTVIGERIGKVIAKERTRAEEAEAKATAAEAKATGLETELAEARKSAPPAAVAGTHPLMLAKTAAEIDARENDIESFLDWAEDHAEGYTSPDETKTPSWTAEQVRAKARELRRERDRIVPAARQLLEKRAAADAALAKTYPAMFAAGTEEARAAQAIRTAMPELNRHANASELVAQMILGRKALDGLKNPQAPAAKPPAEPRRAPRVPGGGGPAKGGEPATGAPSVSDAVKKVMANPTDPRARRAAFAALV